MRRTWRSLVHGYQNFCIHCHSTGKGRHKPPWYYDLLDEVLHDQPTVQPVANVDSMNSSALSLCQLKVMYFYSGTLSTCRKYLCLDWKKWYWCKKSDSDVYHVPSVRTITNCRPCFMSSDEPFRTAGTSVSSSVQLSASLTLLAQPSTSVTDDDDDTPNKKQNQLVTYTTKL